MLRAFSLLLAALTTLLLLRVLGAGRRQPLPRWLAAGAGALVALEAVQALWSLRRSPLALLASIPLGMAVLVVGIVALPRRVRRPPGLLPRALALAGIVLACDGAAGWATMPALPRPRHHAALLDREVTETDLSRLSWSAAFAALGDKLAAEYPFTQWKAIDWPALEARFAAPIRDAEAKRDERAYYRALRAFVWSIPDGHLDLRGDDRGLRAAEVGGGYGLALVRLDDGRVMAGRVDPRGPAAAGGLRTGAEILTWNGEPVAAALARVGVDWSEEPPATAEGRALQRLRFLTHGPVGARATAGFRDPVNRPGGREPGSITTAVLAAVPEKFPRPAGTRWDVLVGDSIETRRLKGGCGYIKVRFELPTLRDLLPEQRVGRAVERFLAIGAPGIVVDVRDNSGGQDEIVPRITAFFQAHPRPYEIAGLFEPARRIFLAHPETAVRVLPAPPRWPRPVAVLVNADTFSAGEGIPLALKGLPNAAVFGWSGTQGSFGVGEKTVHLPAGLDLVFPSGQSLDAGGRIQIDADGAGHGGVEPDHRVPLDEAAFDAAFVHGRDVVLEAALRWIGGAAPAARSAP
jgi:carboxyl-terminal processing protease